jgi:hypothetical protein
LIRFVIFFIVIFRLTGGLTCKSDLDPCRFTAKTQDSGSSRADDSNFDVFEVDA